MTTPQQTRLAQLRQRRKRALSEGQAFVADVDKALDLLKDAIDVAEFRRSDNPETGESLADWNGNVAEVIDLTRRYSAAVAPLLRRIR